MLSPEKMTLVTIAGPKNQMEPAVRTLYGMKLLHVEDGALGASRAEGFDIGEPISGSSEVSDALVRARSLMSRLGIGARPLAAGHKKGLDAPNVAAKKISAAEEKLLGASERLKKADELASKLQSYRSELEPLSKLNLDVSAYSEYRTLAVFTGSVSETRGLKEKIALVSKNYDIQVAEYRKTPIVAVFCERGAQESVQKILLDHGFIEISTKNARTLKGMPVRLLMKINSKIAELDAEKNALQKEIARLGEENAAYLLAHAEEFEAQAEMLGAPLKFATSNSAFVASGWVPEKKYAEFETKLRGAAQDKIYVARSEPAHGNHGAGPEAPIKLSNPRGVRPYEFFLDLYSLPKYTEIDPTFFMFLTFPIFFGFMLGDIGYGLVTLALFTLLRPKMPALRSLLTVMSFSSISAIIFGLAYGEFFGLEKLGEFELPHILSRVHEAEELFMAAVAVGAVHVNIGLFAGFYNMLRMHGFKEALLEKASWLMIEAGAAITALPALGYAALPQKYGYAVAALGLLMLLKGEGIKGVLELPSIVANILSYARLMAVGLVSAILAVVVNENAAELFHAGPIGIAAAILILIVGHGVNIALGLLSPFIHSMRLHYVEFFLKFYHGGGKRYMPFGLKKPNQ